jgi:hypothetical protein
MKKYRRTKITVKTREIVSLSKNAAGEIEISVCPVCQAALSAPLLDAGRRLAELPTAPATDDREKRN